MTHLIAWFHMDVFSYCWNLRAPTFPTTDKACQNALGKWNSSFLNWRLDHKQSKACKVDYFWHEVCFLHTFRDLFAWALLLLFQDRGQELKCQWTYFRCNSFVVCLGFLFHHQHRLGTKCFTIIAVVEGYFFAPLNTKGARGPPCVYGIIKKLSAHPYTTVQKGSCTNIESYLGQHFSDQYSLAPVSSRPSTFCNIYTLGPIYWKSFRHVRPSAF